ncbi:mediator complex subunit 13 C-terminal-domain-containing protein [Cyathus striatus]|nr:mediator complex subunit 13 C-terminal-domain-containing protein [Cyathus striatus]
MSQPVLANDWASHWEYKAISRPLIFCHLQVLLSSSSLFIHPTLLSTPFLDLSNTLPLPAGSPIVLLPHGTPAYYLSTYSGPTSALVKQFCESFRGLGTGNWEDERESGPFSSNSNTFIIGWIKVENRQGEDKGITFIYPTRLCLSYVPSSSARPPLDYIPELPAPLQPSPQVPSAIPSASASLLSQLLQNTEEKAALSRTHSPMPQRPFPQRPPLLSSPTVESLRAFRALTLSKAKDIRYVASEVGGYVDAVARERERERERLKREREGLASSPKLARTTATTPASVSAPTPISMDTPAPAPAPAPASSHPHIPPYSSTSSQPLPVQNFYPSPPQINPASVPPSDGLTSPAIPSPARQSSPALQPALAPAPAPSSSYDPFSTLDASWTQPSNSYLEMDTDMDFGMGMGFPMNMDSSGAGGSGGDTYDDYRTGTMDFDDVDFTDDDFSFFDQPSRVAPVTPAYKPLQGGFGRHQPTPVTASSTLDLGISSSPLFGDTLASGPGPPSAVPQIATTASSWTSGVLLEGFTPVSLETHDVTAPPELVSSSPGGHTPPGLLSAPETPDVHLEYNPGIRKPSFSTIGLHSFDPIPFAKYHRTVDDKYTAGKFALPTPPDDQDRTESVFASSPGPPRLSLGVGAGNVGWVSKYNAITDPSIRIIRKLIGVKRKAPNDHFSRRDSFKLGPWMKDLEEWEKSSVEDDAGDDADARSDLESEEEDLDPDDIDSPLISRPATPSPAYLPLGPTLVHTQFQHSHLLNLSTSLRPPGAAVAPTSITTSQPLPSVPTPVSPAAALGSANKKSKSLEAIACALAVEAVENALWAESWRANAIGGKQEASIWSADVQSVAGLLKSVPGLETLLDLGSLFGINPEDRKALQCLESPMISIGKGDAVIHVLPTAIRFWDKLGLGPRAGRKSVTAFAFFEDNEQRQVQVEGWLSSLSAAYEGKHLGEFKLGSASVCPKDGLVPLRFDNSFRKNLDNFVTNITVPEDATFVFFIVVPLAIMSLTSPTLRQMLHYTVVTFSRSVNASLDVLDRNMLLHIGYTVSECGKWILACCVDERGETYELGVWLTQTQDEDGELDISNEAYIIKKVWEFGLKFSKKTDVEWRIVFSKLGHMTEAEFETWKKHLSTSILVDRQLSKGHVSLLTVEPNAPWIFTDSYSNQLPSKSPTLHRAASSNKLTSTVFTDISSTTYALFPTIQFPVSLPPCKDYTIPASYIADPTPISQGPASQSSESYPSTPSHSSPHPTINDYVLSAESTPLPHPLPYIPRFTSTLIRVPNSSSPIAISMLHIHLLYTIRLPHLHYPPLDEAQLHADITRNYHELNVLAKERLKLEVNQSLPFHLAAVEAMRFALDRDWDRIEAVIDA